MAVLYLDTEFNDSELLSMAFACPDGRQWYAAQELASEPLPWVVENVLPVLGTEQLDRHEFQKAFWKFIRPFYEPTIVCSAPADGAHFLSLLAKRTSMAVDVACDVVIVTPPTGALKPATPHNALSDAVALMEWHQRLIGTPDAKRVWL